MPKACPEGYVPVRILIDSELGGVTIRDGFGMYRGAEIEDLADMQFLLVGNDTISEWLQVDYNGRFVTHVGGRPWTVTPTVLSRDDWYIARPKDDDSDINVEAEKQLDEEAASKQNEDDTSQRFKNIELDLTKEEIQAIEAKKALEKENVVAKVTKTEVGIRVVYVTYTCLRSTGQYENDRVKMRAEVREGEDPIAVARELRNLCERAIKEPKPEEKKPKKSARKKSPPNALDALRKHLEDEYQRDNPISGITRRSPRWPSWQDD